MLSISRARSAEDFAIGGELSRSLGDWDAKACLPYGIPPEVVASFFHSDGDDVLAASHSREDSPLLLARWDGEPAGCIALKRFDDDAVEICKFFVDSAFRGRGVGKALLQATLAEAGRGSKTTVLLHTTVYMKSAVSLYEAFGFVSCPPFRDVPDVIRHTEVFMRRAIDPAVANSLSGGYDCASSSRGGT